MFYSNRHPELDSGSQNCISITKRVAKYLDSSEILNQVQDDEAGGGRMMRQREELMGRKEGLTRQRGSEWREGE